MPPELLGFKYTWDQAGNYSKLLGYAFGDGFDRAAIVKQMKDTVTSHLETAKLALSTVMDRKSDDGIIVLHRHLVARR
jgi:hypothetical protein